MADTTTASGSSSGKVFSLVGKNLKLTTAEDIQPHIDEIDKINGLEEIHLGGNTLGVGACQALGKALERQKSLRIAGFADIFTGRLISEIPDALRALCDSLVGHESLVEMDLSDNAFGGRSAEPMVNFLTHNHHFSVLKLNNNGLGVTGGQIVANALLAAAEELDKQGKPSQLRTVICGRNRLEDGSAPYWAKAYAAHKTLEEVRMFQNGIRMDGIIALAQGLASCPNLKVLDLQDNTATVRGSRGIAAALPMWPSLDTLNLSDCLLKPKGGLAIIEALSKGKNTSLKTLQVQYCDLDRKVLERVGRAIDGGALKNISKLEINGNWADEEDECIESIKKALEKNGHEDALDELDEMDPEGEEDDEEEEEEGDADEEEDSNVKAEIGAGAAAAGGIGAVTAGVAAATIGEKNQMPEEAEPVSAAAAKAPGETREAADKVNADEKSGWASKAENEKAAYNPQDASVMKGDASDDKMATEIAAGAGAGACAAIAAGSAALASAEGKEAEPASTTTEPPSTETRAANDAAEVAESAREVPEEKEAADNAAEVAQSAQNVPEAKDTSVKEAETAKLDALGAGTAGGAALATSQGAAASTQSKEDKVTAAMAKTSIDDAGVAPPAAKHGKSDSVDLSGELYGKDAQSSAGAASSTPAATESPTGQNQPAKKKGPFRAALGAVRELLK